MRPSLPDHDMEPRRAAGCSFDLVAWLNRPLRTSTLFIGWCVATAVFFLIVKVLGGPSYGDYTISMFGTWAIAHGQFGCAFPSGHTTIAPLYPVLSGGVAALAGIGKSVPFPSQASVGPHCGNYVRAVNNWWQPAHAMDHTATIGYIGWIALLIGSVAFLRATGRGRCGWELATLLGLAILPPTWMCMQTVLHPEDLVTMGFVLLAMASARTDRWACAGIFLALAILTQQWALLVAIPLLFLAPKANRTRLIVSALGAGLVVTIPLMVLTSGEVMHAIIQGAASVPGNGGTVLWDTHLRGRPLFVGSRLVPLALSLLLSRFVARRWHVTVHDATALMALVAFSLGLRLVFEEAIFGYYFMAFAVSLVLLDVVRGQVRDSTVAWVAAMTLAYDMTNPSFAINSAFLQRVGHEVLPFLAIIAATGMIVYRAVRKQGTLVWCALLACGLLEWDVAYNPLHFTLAPPLWQALIVGSGLMLAAGPLLQTHRRDATVSIETHLQPLMSAGDSGPMAATLVMAEAPAGA